MLHLKSMIHDINRRYVCDFKTHFFNYPIRKTTIFFSKLLYYNYSNLCYFLRSFVFANRSQTPLCQQQQKQELMLLPIWLSFYCLISSLWATCKDHCKMDNLVLRRISYTIRLIFKSTGFELTVLLIHLLVVWLYY